MAKPSGHAATPAANSEPSRPLPSPDELLEHMDRVHYAGFKGHPDPWPWQMGDVRGLLKQLPSHIWPWRGVDPPEDYMRLLATAIATQCCGNLSDCARNAELLARWLLVEDVATNPWKPILTEAFRAAAVARCAAVYSGGDETAEGRTKELLPGLILDRCPCVFGGSEKAMKTLLSVELAAACATGTPFLGRRPLETSRVFALTLETPPATWRERLRRAIESRASLSKGLDVAAALDRVTVSQELKVLRNKSERERFEKYLLVSDTRIVIADPLYLIQPKCNPADLAAQGRALRNLFRPVIEAGATPVFVHHFVKNKPYGEPPSLRDLSGSAVGPFVRSWLLVNRENEYAGGGEHELLFLAGTCAGAHAAGRMHFNEIDWQVKVKPSPASPTANLPPWQRDKPKPPASRRGGER